MSTLRCPCGAILPDGTPSPGKSFVLADERVEVVGQKLRDAVANGSRPDEAFYLALELEFLEEYKCASCWRVVRFKDGRISSVLRRATHSTS